MNSEKFSTDKITMYEYVLNIKKIVKTPIKTIFEVGSLNGADALYLKNCFPFAEVYAIEGLESNYNDFLKNLESIHTYHTIITNYNGTTNWHVKNVNGIHGIFDRGSSYGEIVLEEQKCQTLKNFCESLSINSIDVIKIDVEGATLEVLEGCEDLLQTIKIMHIETESEELFKGQKIHDQVHDFLIKNNFRLLKMTSIEISGTANQHDCIYVNNNL